MPKQAYQHVNKSNTSLITISFHDITKLTSLNY